MKKSSRHTFHLFIFAFLAGSCQTTHTAPVSLFLLNLTVLFSCFGFTYDNIRIDKINKLLLSHKRAIITNRQVLLSQQKILSTHQAALISHKKTIEPLQIKLKQLSNRSENQPLYLGSSNYSAQDEYLPTPPESPSLTPRAARPSHQDHSTQRHYSQPRQDLLPTRAPSEQSSQEEIDLTDLSEDYESSSDSNESRHSNDSNERFFRECQ